MTKNDIIKLACSALKIDQAALLAIFRLSDPEVGPRDVADLMKNEDEKGFTQCSDAGLSLFLDGLIAARRGAVEKGKKTVQPVVLNNNVILKKMRIALELQDESMMEIFKLAGMELTKSELTPYFRKEGHRNFKKCGDKMLRLFLKGVELSGRY